MAILRKRALVDCVDIIAAFHHWMEVTDHTDTYGLENFLQCPMLYMRLAGTHEWMDVPEITKRRIELLKGPHYRAVIKAYLYKTKLP